MAATNSSAADRRGKFLQQASVELEGHGYELETCFTG